MDPAAATPTGTTTSDATSDSTAVDSKAPYDAAIFTGLLPGDRIEVEWLIFGDESDEEKAGIVEEGKSKDEDNEEKSEKVKTWWPAEIIGLVGRSHAISIDDDDDSKGDGSGGGINNDESRKGGDEQIVPVYKIVYDPLPKEGFPDPSEEEVAFVSARLLYNISTEETMTFKREGSASPPRSPRRIDEEESHVCANEDEVRALVDFVVLKTLKNGGLGKRWAAMSKSEQALVSEKIAEGQGALVTELMKEMNDNRMERIVTADVVKRCVERISK